jgi:squalene synthase HpnC
MTVESTYDKVLKFAKSHYENFPVISFLIPKDLRKDVAIIYWFARTADDFADEGNFPEKVRIGNLDNFERRLANLLNGNFEDEFDHALAQTIKSRRLSPEHFYNLLKAFKQDVVKRRYGDFSEVLEYCQNSANPVGRLILELFDIRNKEAFDASDNICTALQLTNFYQDVKIDYKKGRIYFPVDEMAKFGVTESMFGMNENKLNLQELVKYNVERTRKLFYSGRKLFEHLSGKLKVEITWTVFGGEAILDKIEKNNYNVLNKRPALNKLEFILLFLRSIF